MAKTSEDLGPRDDNTIDSQKSDRRRWRAKLGVSADELQAAIDAVGTNSEDVERYLRDRAQPPRTA
jgi:hypothetical protein